MVLDVEIYMKLIFLPKHPLRGCFNKEVNMAKKARLNKKAPVNQEPVVVGPCSPMQELVFQRATEVDFMIIGGSRGE